MPAGRPTSYKPKYCKEVIELGKQGKSQVQIAVALDVPRQTMLSWGDSHPEFSAALTRAKECEQAWWEDKGMDGLESSGFNGNTWWKSMTARFRGDYTERTQSEITGKDGGPIQHEQKTDLSKLTDEQLEHLGNIIAVAKGD